MRLFEAILDANNRAVAGDKSAGVHVAEFADALPVVALTCIDPRLNPLMPAVLGIPEEHFIWLRNAGNVITSTMSSTVRSLALACVVKGGREIAIIGHTDCRVGQTSVMQLTDRFRALGVDRAKLPENLTEFFGVFASDRQNVLKAVDFVRHSPVIGPKIPVHGLLVDIRSGKLEWLVNGYQTLDAAAAQFAAAVKAQNPTMQTAFTSEDFHLGEMKFPETKIGETVSPAPPRPPATDWMKEAKVVEAAPPELPPKLRAEKGKPTAIPAPPPLAPRIRPQPRPPQVRKAWWE